MVTSCGKRGRASWNGAGPRARPLEPRTSIAALQEYSPRESATAAHNTVESDEDDDSVTPPATGRLVATGDHPSVRAALSDRVPVIARRFAVPHVMTLDAGYLRRPGQIVGKEEQAAPPVLKVGFFPVQPGPVASGAWRGRLVSNVTVMPEWIFDHEDRDLSNVRSLRPSSDEPVL